jgi:glycosyltransferase involved in cell wall biosynthesis
MRIGINCRCFEYLSGGAKEYLSSLIPALLSIDDRNTYVLFYATKRHFGLFPGVEEVSLDCSNRLIFDWLKLPGALETHHIDVAFFPSSNMPPRIPCKAVATMHDLGYFYKDFRMYKWVDTLYMKRAMTYTVHRADKLIANSHYTKKDMIEILKAPAEKITVTYLAADPMYHQPLQEDLIKDFQLRHGFMRPFFLYTGTISPRKNLETLLKAFSAIYERVNIDLVVTGGRTWDRDWNALLAPFNFSNRVLRLGHLPRCEMPLLYASALAYVYPSLFEGFGLPVLEAQAMGVPVICSNATSLPEVAQESALMIDPHDVVGLTTALEKVATDINLRENLIALGHANAKRFSWKDTATKTLEVFEAVHSTAK